MESAKVKSGIAGLDAMLGGGFLKNSVVAVTGGTGAGRTIFCSQFLYKGATEFSEPGLFISFDSQREMIFPNLMAFGWDMLDLEKKQKIVFIDYPQNELAAFAEQESAMKDLIATLGIKRVVIDSVTPYALMFSTPEERKLSVLKLVNAVRGWKVTCLISAETVHASDEAFPHTVSGVESFADGFIHLSYFRHAGKRQREIEIVKMRGSHHEHEARPAQINSEGFSVMQIAKPPKRKVVPDA